MPPARRATTDKVSLTLAHPLGAEQSKRLGGPDKEQAVGAKIEVSKANARAIIAAGYAQVDPEDPEQVEKILGETAPGQVVPPDVTPKS